MNEFVVNAVANATGLIKNLMPNVNYEEYEVVVLSNEHSISYLLGAALADLKKKCQDTTVYMVQSQGAANIGLRNSVAAAWPGVKMCSSLEECVTTGSVKPYLFFDFVNLRSGAYENEESKQERIARIRGILQDNMSHANSKYQMITCIPAMEEALPEVTNAVAEREYEVIFRNKPEDSLEKYVLQLEDVVREYPQLLSRTQVIRLDRVYGPGMDEADGLWVWDAIRDFFDNKKVTLYEKDRHVRYSGSYVSDALAAMLLAMLNGRTGNIYQVSSCDFTRFQVISRLMEKFPEVPCQLEVAKEEWSGRRTMEYQILNARKLLLLHATNLKNKLFTDFEASIMETALWYQNTEGYVPRSDNDVYYGRMDRIREMELRILDDIDRICKEHKIDYFLTAGTMLGAVRHKNFIPWDDDVDIGMLPKDYKKFLEICPKELQKEFGYQTFSTELTSHYIHDKMRIKNTFFSTKYSNRFPMLNGVYMDLFVYFKTANRPLMQKVHLYWIRLVREIIALKWGDTPKKGKYYLGYAILLPFVRLIPFMWIHKYYIHVLSWFEKSKSKYRVDSMGFNLRKVGAVPDEWFHGRVEAEFCGRKYPILSRYHDFLKHWYGERYMELLPVSQRQSVHDVVRIDLGQYMFDETMHDKNFRDVDLRGELYETK